MNKNCRKKCKIETGVLYKRTGGRNIQVNEEFRAFKYTGEQQISQRNSVLSASPGREAGGAFYGRGTTYTGKELQAANRFASHIKKRAFPVEAILPRDINALAALPDTFSIHQSFLSRANGLLQKGSFWSRKT